MRQQQNEITPKNHWVRAVGLPMFWSPAWTRRRWAWSWFVEWLPVDDLKEECGLASRVLVSGRGARRQVRDHACGVEWGGEGGRRWRPFISSRMATGDVREHNGRCVTDSRAERRWNVVRYVTVLDLAATRHCTPTGLLMFTALLLLIRYVVEFTGSVVKRRSRHVNNLCTVMFCAHADGREIPVTYAEKTNYTAQTYYSWWALISCCVICPTLSWSLSMHLIPCTHALKL